MTTTTATTVGRGDANLPAPANHITTAVFDFGGVFTASPLGLAREAAIQAGVDPDQLIALMLGDYGAESNHPWHRVERGEMSLDDARTWARAETMHRLGVEFDPMVVMAPLMSGKPRVEMVDLVSELRSAGVTTALLTNNAKELRPFWTALADWDSLFDHIVDSSEIGVRKPAHGAFLLALERCGTADPASAVMIDDFQVNLDGAAAVGMQTRLVEEDPTEAIAAIRQLVLR